MCGKFYTPPPANGASQGSLIIRIYAIVPWLITCKWQINLVLRFSIYSVLQIRSTIPPWSMWNISTLPKQIWNFWALSFKQHKGGCGKLQHRQSTFIFNCGSQMREKYFSKYCGIKFERGNSWTGNFFMLTEQQIMNVYSLF